MQTIICNHISPDTSKGIINQISFFTQISMNYIIDVYVMNDIISICLIKNIVHQIPFPFNVTFNLIKFFSIEIIFMS